MMDTPAPGHLVPRPVGKWAMCLVDIKDSLRSLLKATQRIMHAENKCESHEDCAQTVTSIVAAFAAIGQYASSAVGHCSPADPQTGAMTGNAAPFMSASTARNVKCGSHIAQATRHDRQRGSVHVCVNCEERQVWKPHCPSYTPCCRALVDCYNHGQNMCGIAFTSLRA